MLSDVWSLVIIVLASDQGNALGPQPCHQILATFRSLLRMKSSIDDFRNTQSGAVVRADDVAYILPGTTSSAWSARRSLAVHVPLSVAGRNSAAAAMRLVR